jgi:hypothetical protein
VDADLETTLVSGSSYFFSAVAVTLGVQTVADADVAMTAAYGSSSCYSSVADLEATEAEIAVVEDATTCAANCRVKSWGYPRLTKKSLPPVAEAFCVIVYMIVEYYIFRKSDSYIFTTLVF